MANMVNKTKRSIEDLNNLKPRQLDLMSEDELRSIVKQMGNAVRKRSKRMTEQGLESPAMRALRKTGGAITVRGKEDKTQLIKEYRRAKSFLTSETGNLKGYKNFLYGLKEAFKSSGVSFEGGESPSEIQTYFDEVMRIYEDLRDSNPEIADAKYKYEVFEKIVSFVNGGKLSREEITERMKYILTKHYENEQKKQAAESSTSKFFDIGDNE